ncbi:hypothetical protein IWGMT90018_61270 [Mycobacterium kiyosense]|nr:hypothetical protein IWGMT90018_61270 [Mycobacterium kiyosense]
MGVLVEGAYACAAAAGGTRTAGPASTLAFYGALRHNVELQREFLTRTRQELVRIGEG